MVFVLFFCSFVSFLFQKGSGDIEILLFGSFLFVSFFCCFRGFGEGLFSFWVMGFVGFFFFIFLLVLFP